MNRNKVYLTPLCVIIPMDIHSARVCCSQGQCSETSTDNIVDKVSEEANEVEPGIGECELFPHKALPIRHTVF
ncbi:MAG: hypothetical protein MJZ18_03795 [Bacteroidales bacterium]|nr:hypothetical protein [Bacteroidales bacterium]